MESNHCGFQFMEEMSQRLEVALIRVLILLLNHIYSSLTLSYNLSNFFSLFFVKGVRYGLNVFTSFNCASLLKTELMSL